MNKLFTKIAGVTLGFAMAIGVGVAVAGKQDVKAAKAEPTTLTWSNFDPSTNTYGFPTTATITGEGQADPVYTDSSHDMTFVGNNIKVSKYQDNPGYLMVYGNYYFYNSSAVNGYITSVVVTFNTGSVSTSAACTIGLGTSAGKSLSGAKSSKTTQSAGGTCSVETSADNHFSYFSIDENGGKSKNLQIATLVVTYEPSTGPVVPVAVEGVTLNKNALTIPVGKNTTLVPTVEPANATNKNVTWSSDNTSVATVSNGVVTGVAEGQATITAETEDGGFTAECVVTVIEPAYSVGFESSESFTGSTSYKHASEVESGPTDAKWGFVYGAVTTTASKIISGSQTPLLRNYTDGTARPTAYMKFDIAEGHELRFTAKSSTNSTFDVLYSTDSGANWTTLLDDEAVTSSSKEYVATISSYVSKARFKILWNATTSSADLMFDDVQIFTMEAPTEPVISITSKDGNGKMSGALGSTSEVTWTTDNDEGLTLAWVLTDTASVVSWTKPNVTFLALGDDATLTAQLKDGNEVVASDSVILHSLQPTVLVKYNGSGSNQTIFAEDEGLITAEITNNPVGSTVTWETDDTAGAYLSFNTSTGATLGIAAGVVNITAKVMYNSSAVATDSIKITVNDLGTASLVISTGTGRTTFKYGESLDTTGWTAVYTDRKGVETDVLSSLNFGSLDYIGTRTLKASYEDVESNGVDITVTNNGASSASGTTSDIVSSKTGSTNMSANTEYPFTLSETLENISEITLTLTVNIPTTSGGPYSHGITFKAYDDQEKAYTSEECIVSCKASSQGNVFSKTLVFDETINITKISYVFSTKASGSNARDRDFSYVAKSAIENFDSKQSLAWAQYFIDEVGTLCSADGKTSSANVQAICDKWESLGNEYAWMEGNSKNYFANRTSNAKIAQVLGMYEKIVARYGQTNFIVDANDNAVVNPARISDSFGVENNDTAILIVVIAIASISAFGCLLILKKRKHQ